MRAPHRFKAGDRVEVTVTQDTRDTEQRVVVLVKGLRGLVDSAWGVAVWVEFQPSGSRSFVAKVRMLVEDLVLVRERSREVSNCDE